jgi:hypothetical protein
VGLLPLGLLLELLLELGLLPLMGRQLGEV